MRHRVGYAPPGGTGLATALGRHGLPLGAAQRVGLLDGRGREFLAGRIVIPEWRPGGPIWAIGRTLDGGGLGPRYLGLPGPKPLLGLGEVWDRHEIYLTEGPFDRLALGGWGLPAVALVGTRPRREVLDALTRFARLYLVLDGDAAGRAAAVALRTALGARAVPVMLPGVKDVADLALRPDGRDAFLRAVAQAAPEEEDAPRAA